MSAIAGIASVGKTDEVKRMLQKMEHRGPAGQAVLEQSGATLGVAWSASQSGAQVDLNDHQLARDYANSGHFAQAQIVGETVELSRDPLGVAPLYYGWTDDGALCFASEVKGLQEVTNVVHELLPGHGFDGTNEKVYFTLAAKDPLNLPAEALAKGLRQRLENSVEQSAGEDVGAWLSGGLDSSAMAALARPGVSKFHTFAAGLPDAPDLQFARMVADYIQAEHHEVIVSAQDLIDALPDVIYHLESFDALLVRSSLTNYLVASAASDYVSAVFSGEGGDELFAGYDYLKSLDPQGLPEELIDITDRLHNTALQRVDRSASAHGTVAHVGFLDPQVVDFAVQIPAEYKLRNGVEKWILRQAVADVLPEAVVNRTKSKFWEGAGVQDILLEYAEEQISDADFACERNLPNGWMLNTKEELLDYRIFKEHFGDLTDLDWMGRTKGAPVE